MSTRKWIIGLVVAGALTATFVLLWRPKGKEYCLYASPDGRFQIVVFRVPTAFAMPGG